MCITFAVTDDFQCNSQSLSLSLSLYYTYEFSSVLCSVHVLLLFSSGCYFVFVLLWLCSFFSVYCFHRIFLCMAFCCCCWCFIVRSVYFHYYLLVCPFYFFILLHHTFHLGLFCFAHSILWQTLKSVHYFFCFWVKMVCCCRFFVCLLLLLRSVRSFVHWISFDCVCKSVNEWKAKFQWSSKYTRGTERPYV